MSLKFYLNNPDFSDISLFVENQILYGHKVILSAKSPTFREILSNQLFKDSSISPLLIEDISFNVFYSILEYIYTDGTTYNMENVWDLMKAARYFKLSELLADCTKFIKQNINSHNVHEVWKKASTMDFGNIIDHILLHFKDFGNHSKKQEKTVQQSSTKIEKQNPFAIEQTHYFSLWDDQSLPPTAFPTNETLNSFPEFFNVKDEEQKPLEKRDSISMTRKLSLKDSSVGVALQQLLNAITKMFNCERSTLFLYDKENDELYSQVAKGQDQIRVKITEGMIGDSFKTGKTLKQKNDEQKYVICLPIIKDKQVIGVLEVLNKSIPFTNEDDSHLKTISILFSYLFGDDQRRKSIVDVNTNLINDDFLLKDNNLDENRGGLDFLLPNEELDTSYNSLIRSCSISLERPLEIVENVEPPVVKEEEKKKRKRKNENMQFMHFRIPRKELQFVNFEAPKKKK